MTKTQMDVDLEIVAVTLIPTQIEVDQVADQVGTALAEVIFVVSVDQQIKLMK